MIPSAPVRHECAFDTAFGHNLPCALCSEGEVFQMEFGPSIGFEKSNPIYAKALFQRQTIRVVDSLGFQWIFGVWKLKSVTT